MSDNQNPTSISSNVHETMKQMKALYGYPENTDIMIRSIMIPHLNKQAYIVYISSIIDVIKMEQTILRPLMTHKEEKQEIPNILPTEDVQKKQQISQITLAINNGNVALFMDNDPSCYLMNCAQFKGRNIESSQNEITLKGPKETFVENVDTNFSLIRKKIKNENLIIEEKKIASRSHDEVFICYMKNLTNEDLLADVRQRIGRIDVDGLQNLSMLEQYIEERPSSVFPSLLYTERPDRTARAIENGSIVLLMNNSADALILPATFWDLFHSAEDEYLRFPNGYFIRLIRVFSLVVTMLISSVYISVTTFHPEMIPTDLLMAVAASREKVPFNPVIEILLMETAFELIREAGLRVPLPIGPTIGIVGALILGQAAVQANIVSPIVVIIVALGALSSFVIGDIGLNFAIRICRFLFIYAAFLYGFFGTVSVFAVLLMYMISLRSFGVPFFLPVTPSYLQSGQATIRRNKLRNRFLRPKYLKPKDITKS